MCNTPVQAPHIEQRLILFCNRGRTKYTSLLQRQVVAHLMQPLHVLHLMHLLFLLSFVGSLGAAETLLSCADVHTASKPSFSLVRWCALPEGPALVRAAGVRSWELCQRLALRRGGLAFAFAPRVARGAASCLVYSCPDEPRRHNRVFHYYTTLPPGVPKRVKEANYTCAAGVGLVKAHHRHLNYTAAAAACAEEGGALADVLGERRTAALAAVVAAAHFPKAFVGLDDRAKEGQFVAVGGVPLGCVVWRAWAPGEPKERHRDQDCVVLSARRLWHTLACDSRQPFLCVARPPPALGPYGSPNNPKRCRRLPTQRERKQCREELNAKPAAIRSQQRCRKY